MTLNSDAISKAREKALAILRIAVSKKASHPVLIRLSVVSGLTDFFLIVTGGSARHVQAIAEAITTDLKASHVAVNSVEGLPQGNWALLDYGDVIVHVFQPEFRDFYDLEGLWSDAPRVHIPDEITQEMETTHSSIAPDDLDEWDE